MAINFDYNYPQVAREGGFKLKQYKDGPLDWRLLGTLEVDRILREQTLEQLDGILNHLAEVPLATMLETNILDSGIAKYFILSQYSIQYLLFCRKFLDETIKELRESYAASQIELAKVRKLLSEANNEILQLHKKITQMEAIHEVIYPCHMCTKNFVSNEALNIHIGRKHASRIAMGERRQEIDKPVAVIGQKERDNDLDLINTIKLELEIKQLKERLNIAEKEIRERSTLNSKRTTPREQPIMEITKTTKNIGIQSNLIEAKEKDEAIDESDVSSLSERKEQLEKLHEKISAFENWKETQIQSNEAFLAEINKKLTNISQTVAQSKTTNASLEEERREQDETKQEINATSTTMENLEHMLMQKISEIGETSAKRLEETVLHMELNYKEKLTELEREIKKATIIKTARETQAHRKLEKTTKLAESESTTEAEEIIEKSTKPKERTKKSMIPVAEIREKNIDTHTIQDFKENPIKTARAQSTEMIASLSTESNRTFIKSNASREQAKDSTKAIAHLTDSNDSTDISESLSTETPSSEDSEDDKNIKQTLKSVKRPKTAIIKSKQTTELSSSNEAQQERAIKETINIKTQLKPKKYTRNDAKRLVNKRLVIHGINLKTKTISTAAMKRLNEELAENRNKLKQKQPQFYAARNKIKKFVDKLCSKKLPLDAEVMLKSTQPLQPMENVRIQKHYVTPDDDNSSADSFDEHGPEEVSTPMQTSLPTSNEAFKERLERILGSPMQKPTTTAAEVHTKHIPLPVPMPRKRVMFDTNNRQQMNSMSTIE